MFLFIIPIYESAKCKLTDKEFRVDSVTGKVRRTGLSYCSTERMFAYGGDSCGREGNNFEQKENNKWKFPKISIKVTK